MNLEGEREDREFQSRRAQRDNARILGRESNNNLGNMTALSNASSKSFSSFSGYPFSIKIVVGGTLA